MSETLELQPVYVGLTGKRTPAYKCIFVFDLPAKTKTMYTVSLESCNDKNNNVYYVKYIMVYTKLLSSSTSNVWDSLKKVRNLFSQMTFLKTVFGLQAILGQSFTMLPLHTIYMKWVLLKKIWFLLNKKIWKIETEVCRLASADWNISFYWY